MVAVVDVVVVTENAIGSDLGESLQFIVAIANGTCTTLPRIVLNWQKMPANVLATGDRSCDGGGQILE